MDKKQTVDPINKARISLSDRLKKRGDSPKYLTNEVKSPAELELNALQEIIRLREEGKPRDSLAPGYMITKLVLSYLWVSLKRLE